MGTICCGSSSEEHEFAPLQRKTAQEKLGKYTGTNIPPFYRSTVLKAVKIAEQRKGKPPFFGEVYKVVNEISWYPALPNFIVRDALNDLWRNDEILCDIECDRFSMNPAL